MTMFQKWLILLLMCQTTLVVSAPQMDRSQGMKVLFSEPYKLQPGPEKNWTGHRVSHDSNRAVYYHEQTIAIVELGRKRELLCCELLEVRTPKDRTATLSILRGIKPKTRISFIDMMDLMKQCHKVPTPQNFMSNTASNPINNISSFAIVFQGIVPGTKWCGRGDLAENFFDLGSEETVDRCCRTHDMCPVKVAAMRTQYNITNYNMATSSHCGCDQAFYGCLKSARQPMADLIGNTYFNIGNLKCVDDVVNENKVIKRILRSNNLRY